MREHSKKISRIILTYACLLVLSFVVVLAMAAGGDQLTVYPMETKKEAREMP